MRLPRANILHSSDDMASLLEGKTSSRGSTWVLATMSGRYALAAGEIQGVRYDPTNAALAYEPGHIVAFFYDLSWYLRTTMLF